MCGFTGQPEERCVGVNACQRCGAKISGPLHDRIDIHVEVPHLKPEELFGMQGQAVRERVIRARALQMARLGGHRVNAKMTPPEVREMLELDQESQDFMRMVSSKMNISARVFDRTLRVGRTIADLAGS